MKIEIASYKNIYNSEEKWNELLASMKAPSIFLTWDWIVTWIKFFGKEYKLFVFFIYDEKNELVAILPLARTISKLENGLFTLKLLSFCGSIELYPDHLDLICSKNDDPEAYLNLIFSYLSKINSEWDIINFAYLSENGGLASYLLKFKYNDIKICFVKKQPCPYLHLEHGLSEILKPMKRKKRYNLRRERKKIYETKKLNFEQIKSIDKIDNAIDNLFSLHQIRAANMCITSTFSGDQLIDFHKEISKKLLHKDQLRLYLLVKEENSVAAAYGYLYQKKYYFYQTGFNTAWQQYSPGKILILSAIEHLCNEGVLEFDFLGGEEKYKKYWTKNFRNIVTFSVFGKNARSKLEFFSYSFRNTIKSKINNVFRS